MGKIYKILPVVIFLLLAFIPSPNPPPSGWYQQFMPNIGNKQISDISFLDSLNGYAVATQASDSSYILKTTNGGDSWQIVHRHLFAMTHIQFLNVNTGYAGGGYLYKTINGGYNWTQLNTPTTTVEKMYVISQDTIFFVNSESLTGGVFRTINGGGSWIRQYNGGTANPIRIYMHPNAMLGFYSDQGNGLWRTLNGGFNWSPIGTNEGFTDIYFVDSSTGWKCSVFGMKKTTNAGLNWVTQTLPSGGFIQTNGISSFSNINRDTIWGNGGYILYPNNHVTEFLNRTTNGGTNWLFQIPDSSFQIGYRNVNFTNKLNGWSYYNLQGTGIHTVTGGDTTFYTGIQQISNAVPEKIILKQNYPNPFNPRTVIPYSLSSAGYVKIIAYDITGKEVQKMVDNYQHAGAYEVDFMGKFTATGVYFYRMEVDGEVVGTKKMILLK